MNNQQMSLRQLLLGSSVSLGDWDGEFYLREQSPYASRLLSYEAITLADYVTLSRTTPDYDLGVSVHR